MLNTWAAHSRMAGTGTTLILYSKGNIKKNNNTSCFSNQDDITLSASVSSYLEYNFPNKNEA